MSIFDKVFGNSGSKGTPSSSIEWIELTEIQQLDDIVAKSAETPALIFKHSTRCSISRFALKNFESEYAIDRDKLKPYFLDLLEHRNISNEIASRFGVMHQSPQVILIKDGKAIYNSSHSDIDAGKVKNQF